MLSRVHVVGWIGGLVVYRSSDGFQATMDYFELGR